MAKKKIQTLGLKSDADKLLAYLNGEVLKSDLGFSLAEKVDQVITCSSLILEHKFPSAVVPILKETFGVSEATGWRILRLTNQVYGPLLQQSRQMKKAIAEEMIKEDRAVAKAKKDRAAMAMSTKNYILLHGLDKEETELPDFSDFEGHNLIIAVLPEQVGVNPPSDEKILKEKFAQFLEDNSEEAEYEE